MSRTAIKDFRIKESYTRLVEKALMSYLWEGIYKPMFEIMQIKPDIAKNEYNPIIEALMSGKIYYVDGYFKSTGKFSNAQSQMLERWGAKWDKYQKGYKISQDKIPQNILTALAQNKIQTEAKVNALQDFLREVEANMQYIVDSMVFDDEVITILDDAQNEVKKNIRHLNIIEPELSEEQKQEIARTYTNNLRQYIIKDFGNERIPEMRQKVQELVLQGYRPDKVQELLQKQYGIAARKAKFLAQNETSIMLAEYKKVTYQEMGFDKFIWKTIPDGKEPELHKKLNNTVWRYDNPPITDERTGQRGLPGETYNCRCDAVPFTDGILRAKNSDDIEWITVKGNHIPIMKGQSKEQAIKAFFKDKQSKAPVTDGITDNIKKAVKEVYKAYKESNCESTEPAYQYPPTVAGIKRGKPMTFAQADNGRANPYYHKDNYAYSHNCQSSVVAHEARMRGYNVQAAPKQRYGKTEELSRNSAWAWLDAKTNKKCEYTKLNINNAQETYKWFEQNIKSGERYQYRYYWEIKKNGIVIRNGHVINIDRDNNSNIRLYDPQVNKIYIGKNVETYINHSKMIFNNEYLKPGILRVDDKKFNPYFMNDVVKKF